MPRADGLRIRPSIPKGAKVGPRERYAPKGVQLAPRERWAGKPLKKSGDAGKE